MSLYRAQYAYPPSGFKEETFEYSFDATNVPILGAAIAAGQLVNNIIFQLEQDYEFAWRGTKVQLSTATSQLYLWLKDPFGNYLSQVPVPLSLYLTPSGAPIIGTLPVPMEEIICPAGGIITAFLYNPTAGPADPPAFSFQGVKRCPVGAK